MRICPQGQGKDQMRTALTIAGSDSSGGAGIQADIKTMTANGVYAMSAITALTAQNTTGVTGIMEVTPPFLAEQLDCIFTDIFPDAVKTGMVSSSGLIETIASKLRQYGARNIVVDPVMVATSGAKLLRDDAIDAMRAGIMFGYYGLIKEIVAQMKKELDSPDALVIATGGFANTMTSGTNCIDIVDPMLTLEGLRLIFEKNKKKYVTLMIPRGPLSSGPFFRLYGSFGTDGTTIYEDWEHCLGCTAGPGPYGGHFGPSIPGPLPPLRRWPDGFGNGQCQRPAL